VYHVNLVDEVTQWEVVLSVEEISEKFLLPVLEEALAFFPFEIKNFHSDNGSEYINYTVARLLEKLRISQTKSRPRKSTDNGLVEGKNGAIIRKEFGHWHIPGVFAPRINKFYREYLIPYLNFARPCHFPVKTHDPKTGKILIRYPLSECKTPYTKLCSLDNWTSYLKSSVSEDVLRSWVTETSPLERAKAKKRARDELLKIVLPRLSDTLTSTTTEKNDFSDFFG
jgi:transposase InsO family protein